MLAVKRLRAVAYWTFVGIVALAMLLVVVAFFLFGFLVTEGIKVTDL